MFNSITRTITAARRMRILPALTVLIAATLMAPIPARAQDSAQRRFSSPQAAVDALIAAGKSHDQKALNEILGPDADKVLSSGDPVADRNTRQAFLARYNEMHRLAYDREGRVILYIGADNWPVPIPLIKKDGGWIWDTPAGEQELVYRRIGNNELFTIGVLQNLVSAQHEYHNQKHGRSTVRQYAQKILSDPGRIDGLYWKAAQGAEESPIGPLIAKAAAEGYKRGPKDQPVPFHGYVYKVLTRQGKDAPGGAKNYIVNGKMTRGFAFLAYPVQYRSSGVMTFIVGQDGKVLQKDLGPDTEQIARKITAYDPDKTWADAESEETTQPEAAAAPEGKSK